MAYTYAWAPRAHPTKFELTALPAAQCLHELYRIGRAQRMSQVEHLIAIDEESHVAAHALLFVDHAEAQAGILAVEVGEQFSEGRTAAFYPLPAGVGKQRARNQHLH